MALGLREAIKNEWQKLRADAAAVVADDEARALAAAQQLNVNLAAIGRELDGVRQQVPDDLLQSRRVAAHLAHRGVQGDFDLYRFGFSRGADRVYRHLDDRRERERARFDAQLAADDARHVEDVFDQLGLRLRIALDGLQAARQRRRVRLAQSQ